MRVAVPYEEGSVFQHLAGRKPLKSTILITVLLSRPPFCPRWARAMAR